MEEEEASHLVATGSSVCRAFTSGYKFTLAHHYREDMNSSYLLTEVQHVASVGSSYSLGDHGTGERDVRLAGQKAGSKELFDSCFACARAAVHRIDSAIVAESRSGISRAGPRLRGYGVS